MGAVKRLTPWLPSPVHLDGETHLLAQTPAPQPNDEGALVRQGSAARRDEL